MRWWRRMRTTLWPFDWGRQPSPEAREAVACADRSASRAERDRLAAARRRAEAEHLTEQLRAHNTANRYDDWLRQVVRGQGS